MYKVVLVVKRVDFPLGLGLPACSHEQAGARRQFYQHHSNSSLK